MQQIDIEICYWAGNTNALYLYLLCICLYSIQNSNRQEVKAEELLHGAQKVSVFIKLLALYIFWVCGSVVRLTFYATEKLPSASFDLKSANVCYVWLLPGWKPTFLILSDARGALKDEKWEGNFSLEHKCFGMNAFNFMNNI